MHGRITNVDLPEERIMPVPLPKKAYFTTLLIKDFHNQNLHAGISRTLAQIRSKYWLPQGRAQVKEVLAECLTCITHQGGPYKVKPMAPWPKIKVKESPAFTHIGLDYFGPLYVKNGTIRSKAWVCIFTCIAVRAIHPELVEDVTAAQFLDCLRRFIARRGKPDEIISDNAPQFKVAKNAIDLA